MGNLIVEQYPEDIKLGVKQVLRVMCGTEQVWPRQTGFTCVVKIKGGSTYTKVFSKQEIQSIFSTGGAYAWDVELPARSDGKKEMLFLEFTRSNYNGVVSVYIAGYIEEPTSYGPVEHYFTTSDYSEPYDPDALDFIEMSYSKNDFDYDCLTPNTEHNIATIYIARKEEVSFVVNYSTPLTNGSVPIKLTKDEMEAIDVGSTQLIGTYEVSTERGGKIYNDNLTIKIKRTSTEFTIIGTLGAATEEYTCGFTDESFIMPNGTIPYKTLSITYNVFSYNEAMWSGTGEIPIANFYIGNIDKYMKTFTWIQDREWKTDAIGYVYDKWWLDPANGSVRYPMFTNPINNAYYSLVGYSTRPSDEYPDEMHYVTYTIGIHLGSSTPTYKVSTDGDAFYSVVGSKSGTTNSGMAYDLYLTIDTVCRITEDRPRPATGDQIRFTFEAIT